MQRQGRPGGFRLVGVGVELVGLGVEPPDEEEAGDGGGEEDEDHPQRAHLSGLVFLFLPRQKESNNQSINLAWVEGNHRSQESRRLWLRTEEKRKSNGGFWAGLVVGDFF